MLVAFTEKWLLFSVYGKVLSRVMLICVFRVGFAESGESVWPALVVVIVVILRVLVTVWPLMTTVTPTVCPADTLWSKAPVRHTSSVDVEVCGVQAVCWASLNLMSTTLVWRFQGNCVPEMVRLSPPNKFKSVVGTTEEMVQVIVSAVSDALLLTKPYFETSLGRWSPHTGS